MWHWHGGWDSGEWLSMTVMMVLVWLPLLLLIAFALRALVIPGRSERSGSDPAEEEARRAYARGDLDREQFQQVMLDLKEYRRGT